MCFFLKKRKAGPSKNIGNGIKLKIGNMITIISWANAHICQRLLFISFKIRTKISGLLSNFNYF